MHPRYHLVVETLLHIAVDTATVTVVLLVVALGYVVHLMDSKQSYRYLIHRNICCLNYIVVVPMLPTALSPSSCPERCPPHSKVNSEAKRRITTRLWPVRTTALAVPVELAHWMKAKIKSIRLLSMKFSSIHTLTMVSQVPIQYVRRKQSWRESKVQ